MTPDALLRENAGQGGVSRGENGADEDERPQHGQPCTCEDNVKGSLNEPLEQRHGIGFRRQSVKRE